MSEQSNRLLIGFLTGGNAPEIAPAPTNRGWMSATRGGWANRCLPLLIANQSGWELRNPSAFSATWMGGDEPASLMIAPDRRDPGQLLPASNFGYGILTWHLPILFRTPPGYDLLVRGPANHPKDAVSPLEGIVETDWATSSFSMNWKFTRQLMPVRFEVDEPICMIVPQRRAELEEFAPELRPIQSDDETSTKAAQTVEDRGESCDPPRRAHRRHGCPACSRPATALALPRSCPWQLGLALPRDVSEGNARTCGAVRHRTRSV